jgi:hypothetical protein
VRTRTCLPSSTVESSTDLCEVTQNEGHTESLNFSHATWDDDLRMEAKLPAVGYSLQQPLAPIQRCALTNSIFKN